MSFSDDLRKIRTRVNGLHPGRAGTPKAAVSVVRSLALFAGELLDKTDAARDRGWRFIEKDLHDLQEMLERRQYEYIQGKARSTTDDLHGVLERVTAGPKYPGYYTSRTKSGRSKSWPVELLNKGDGSFYHVRGLTGRFKGRTFSIVASEYSAYPMAKVQYAPQRRSASDNDAMGRRLERELAKMRPSPRGTRLGAKPNYNASYRGYRIEVRDRGMYAGSVQMTIFKGAKQVGHYTGAHGPDAGMRFAKKVIDQWHELDIAPSPRRHSPEGGKFVRRPIVRIVIHEGGPGKRRGTLIPWVAIAYDERGDIRSRVTDPRRAYVEAKVAEWWPGVPVEYVSRSTQSSSPRGSGKPHHFYIVVGRLGPSAVAVDYKGASVNVINGNRDETVETIRRAAHKHWPGLREKAR